MFVPYPATGRDIQLETTVYRPATPPPWPLVVINHGSRGLDNPHLQDRNRPVETARFFLARGYLVVAPMRQGFSRSTGTYLPSRCMFADYARRFAQDIAVVIDHFVAAGEVLPDQVLVTGQSNGGMVALAHASGAPKARALINFAGGINSSNPSCHWQDEMVRAARELGATTRLPSLWIYTEDDKIFPPSVSQPFFEAYRQAGAPATYRLFPVGGHPFSTTRQGRETWGPEVSRFLQQVGLPHAEVIAKEEATAAGP